VYGLNGRMQKVAESVYLITPFNVEISADEKRRLAEHGFFSDF
jgi:cell division inhibitor SepF